MTTLIFARKNIGELQLSCAPVYLVDSLSQGMKEGNEVHFAFRGLDYHIKNEFPVINWKQTPLFFEWQGIDVFFESSVQSRFYPPFKFLINGQETGLVSRQIGEGQKMTGTIRIEKAVGLSELKLVDARNIEMFVLEMEVFPQKLDYKEDFHEMISEITDILYNLAFDFLKKTYTFTIPRHSISPTLSEWLAILHTLFESLELSIDQIRRSPSSKIIRENQLRPVERIKQSSRHSIKWIRKNPRYTSLDKTKGIPLNEKIHITHLPEQHRQRSYDTYANRFVKWAIEQIIQQIDRFAIQLKKQIVKSGKISKELKTLTNYKSRLQYRLKDPVFRQISDFDQDRQFSTVLNMSPAYRDFYHRYLLLQKGLYLYDHKIFRMDYKDIATLYEYWCFLKLVQCLRRDAKFSLENQDLIRIEHKRLSLRLQKGNASEICLNNNRGDKIKIFYNKRLEADTFTQIPDNLVEFYKAGYQRPFRIVIDAKYRFDRASKNYPVSKIKNGPPLDAIAQLHRYRDAILFSEKQNFSTGITADKALGGAILFPFPGNEQEFRQHPFFKSIHEANIGALPLLPGKNKKNELFRAYLRDMFEASPEALYEQLVEYDKSEYHDLLKQLSHKVLIGQISQENYRSHWEAFFYHNTYYTPYSEYNEEKLETVNIIAFYDAKNQMIAGYGAVKSVSFVIEDELDLNRMSNSISFTKSKEKYLKYTLENIVPCSLPIKDLHDSKLTNEFALLKAIEYQNQAYLKIRTYDEVKMWRQLYRIDQELDLTYEVPLIKRKKQLIFYFEFQSVKIYSYSLEENNWRFTSHNRRIYCDYGGAENVREFLLKNIKKLTS